jgi:type IX secretion system PorP/SprF family membrane protein
MKDFRIIILLSFMLAGLYVQAQQLPVYNLYMLEETLYNPSYAGTDEDVMLTLDFKGNYNQIAGSPLTGWAGFDMPIRKANIGIGANFFVDNVGARNNIGGAFSYAYHIPFSEEYTHRLSIGLSAGVFHQRFNFLELTPYQENDPSLNLNNSGATTFDMNVGVNYQWKGLFVGFSVPQVINGELRFREGGNSSKEQSTSHLRRHYWVNAGYEAAMGKNKNFFLEPSVAVRKVKGLPVQFDANLMFDWDRQVWVGASYKTANTFEYTASFAAITGFNIKDRLDITYALDFDFDATERSDFGYGHEFVMKVRFGKRFREIEARMDTMEEAIKRNALEIAANGERIDSLEDEMSDVKDQVNANTEGIANNAGDIREINENLTNIFNTVEELMEKSNVAYKKIGSVYFKVDSDKLTDEAANRLDAFVQQIDELGMRGDEFFIYVAGNASEEAPNDYNMLLSTRRAAAVKKYLEDQGVGGSIFLLSYGEEAPVVSPQRNEEERAQNRRVDIFLSGNTGK